MFADARITAAFNGMMQSIDAPPVRLRDILARMSLPQPPLARPHYPRFAIAAAAVVAVGVVALPAVAPGLVQTLEARLVAILQWQPPPPAPESVLSAMKTQGATLAAAQSRVSFAIVPPAGLPSDVVSAKISTTPTGVYSKITHSWSVGSPTVTFGYRRAGGRSFTLNVEGYDPQAGPPSRYMFEELGTARDGSPILKKHERFAWRNGNQITTAIEGDGITAREIESIRVAMHGIAIPRANTRAALDSGTKVKMYKIAP